MSVCLYPCKPSSNKTSFPLEALNYHPAQIRKIRCNFLAVAVSIAGFPYPLYVREACECPFFIVRSLPVTDDKPILVNFKDLSNDWSPAIIVELQCNEISFFQKVNISVFLHILGSPGRVPKRSCVNLLTVK